MPEKPHDRPDNIGRIAENMSFVWKELGELKLLLEKVEKEQKDGFDELKNFYINRNEFEMYKTYGDARETRIANLEKKTENYSVFEKAMYVLLGSVILGFLYALINYFIPNAHIN